MSCAIVVLNYNDAKLTIKYLSTIKNYSAYNHIIVVDNASTDGMTGMLKEYCEENNLDFIESHENKGYSAGNNMGAFYAIEKYNPEFIVISNPDIICSEMSILKILEFFSHSNDIGLVTGAVHVFDADHDIKAYPYFAYKVPTLTEMMLNNFLVLTKLRMCLFRNSIYFDPTAVQDAGWIKVGAVSGCFFAIRSDVFRMIEGFDEDIFLYNEESVLGFKLMKAGYKEIVIDALVIHDEKTDKHIGLRKQWVTHKRVQKSALVYLRKYLHAGTAMQGLYRGVNTFGFIERSLLYILRRGMKHD